MTDAPPDAGLLADALEALEAGRLPLAHALEEVVHLLKSRPSVVAEQRRARAVRYARALRDLGDYPSTRALAPRVAREFSVSPETVRQWVGIDAESPHGGSDDAA